MNGRSIIIPPQSISFKLLSAPKSKEFLKFFFNFRYYIFINLLYHGVLDTKGILG